jgi:GT2 family glycosyltransferase
MPLETTLVIANYNQSQVLSRCLLSVVQQSLLPSSVVIADDGSSDDSRLVALQFTHRLNLTFVTHPKNGFHKTKILNAAIRASREPYIIFSDADCLFHRHFIRDHTSLAEKNWAVSGSRALVLEPNTDFDPITTNCLIGLITGRIKNVRAAIRVPFAIIERPADHAGVLGCNMAFWRQDLVNVNGFDEKYRSWGYGEDSDIMRRVMNSGIRRKSVMASAIVFHIEHPTIPPADMHRNRNKFNYVVENNVTMCEYGLSYRPL